MNLDEFNSQFQSPITHSKGNMVIIPMEEFTATVETTIFDAEIGHDDDGKPIIILRAHPDEFDSDTEPITWRLSLSTARRLRSWFNKVVMQADREDVSQELDRLSKWAKGDGESHE